MAARSNVSKIAKKSGVSIKIGPRKGALNGGTVANKLTVMLACKSSYKISNTVQSTEERKSRVVKKSKFVKI